MNKTVNWLLALLACVLVSGCSSTNDNSEDEPAVILSTIVGRWNVTSYKGGTQFIPAPHPEYLDF